MAEAIGAGSVIAIATSEATSIASAVANAIATATAGIAIGLGYAGGQTMKSATNAVRDYSRSIVSTVLSLIKQYFIFLTEKPEVGLTGTLLALYLIA